jgi:hypothetical protein
MSEYKGIKGFQVQTRTEDPVPYAQALADNPYAGVWSAGGNVNSARFLFDSGVGSLTAGLIAGNSPSPNAEQYNGTSWTNITSLGNNTAGRAGAGTSTAALEFGGTPGLGVTEYWNGSSWTELNDLNTGRNVAGGIGTAYTAALCAGGDAPGYVANVESWNGSTWTEVNDLNTARGHATGVGTQTNGILVGSAPPLALTETWNGSSWTETTDLNTGRYGLAGSGASSTDALVFGGESPAPGFFANTESWDGSSWTEVNDMATARYYLAGAGTSSSAWAASGETTNPSSATEEWTFSGLDPSTTPAASYADAITGDFYYNSTTGQFKTVNTGGAPLGAWASGGSMNTARSAMGSGGTQTSAINMAGRTPSTLVVANVEAYDGSAWSNLTNVNTARRNSGGTAAASTAALIYGGPSDTGPPYEANSGSVEQWDGSSWSEKAELNNPRGNLANNNLGSSSTDAFAVAGYKSTGNSADVESWNGSAWTETTEVNTGRYSMGGFGLTTSSLVFGGEPGRVQSVESWNGSAWTEVAEYNTPGVGYAGGAGLSNSDGIKFGGEAAPGRIANTEGWDGTTWTEIADLAATVGQQGVAGSSTAGLSSGGYSGTAYVANTEEWTAADFEIKSVTTS